MTDAHDDASWRELVEDIRIQIAKALGVHESRVELAIDDLRPAMRVDLRIDGGPASASQKRRVESLFASIGIRAVKPGAA